MKPNSIPVYVTIGKSSPNHIGDIVFDKDTSILDMHTLLADVFEAAAVEARKQAADLDNE